MGESDSLLPEIWFKGLGEIVDDKFDDTDATAVVAIGGGVDKRWSTLPGDTIAAAAAAAAGEAPKIECGVGRTIPGPPAPAPRFADK